ncbi:MAG: hypothetical protein HY042_03315 [Spirochaetia bacterium]|nr:hypothetical protein [Spirochaetia bacterium]
MFPFSVSFRAAAVAVYCAAAALLTLSCRMVATDCSAEDPSCHLMLLAVRPASTAAAASFSPSSVSGLRFWVRAEGLSYADGGSVTSWPDLSGTGNTITPGTAPAFYANTNTINGRPVVRYVWGGGSKLLNAAPVGVSASDSGSTFLTLRMNVLVNHNVFLVGGLGTGGREFQITNTGTISLNKSGLTVIASYAAGWAVGAVHQVSVLQNAGSNIRIRMDGVEVVNAVPGAVGYAAGSLGVGGNGQGNDVAEVLFYDNRVSDQDALKIECYLGARYGTSVCP